MKVRVAPGPIPRRTAHRQLGTQRGERRGEEAGTSSRRPGAQAIPKAEAQPNAPRGRRPERWLTHITAGKEVWPGRDLGGAGPGGACGRVPPPPSAPAAARPAGVRPERAAEPGPSLGLSDPAMASLPALLCLCVAAAHLAGARGEASPVPSPAPQAPGVWQGAWHAPRVWRENPGTLASPPGVGGVRGHLGDEPRTAWARNRPSPLSSLVQETAGALGMWI